MTVIVTVNYAFYTYTCILVFVVFVSKSKLRGMAKNLTSKTRRSRPVT